MDTIYNQKNICLKRSDCFFLGTKFTSIYIFFRVASVATKNAFFFLYITKRPRLSFFQPTLPFTGQWSLGLTILIRTVPLNNQNFMDCLDKDNAAFIYHKDCYLDYANWKKIIRTKQAFENFFRNTTLISREHAYFFSVNHIAFFILLRYAYTLLGERQ